MGKPILDRLFEKKNKNKMTAAEKKAQERERKKEEKTCVYVLTCGKTGTILACVNAS